MAVGLGSGPVRVKIHRLKVTVECHAHVAVLAIGVAPQIVCIGQSLFRDAFALNNLVCGTERLFSLAAREHVFYFLYGFHLVLCFIGAKLHQLREKYTIFAQNNYLFMDSANHNKNDQQRLGQLKNLVMLAAADGHLTDSEMAVLLAVASREKLTPDEFNKVIDDPDSVTIDLPEDEDTKLAYLRDMVAMMMIDGELNEQEMAICKLYAMALGYRGSIVDGMIAGVIDQLDAEFGAAE